MTVAKSRQPGKAWTLTGAARAAREARISTVRHLRTAAIARTWQMGALASAYQIQLGLMGDPARARAWLFGAMGYRPPFPADLEAAAEMVVADEAYYLAETELYVLTPQMCAVTVAAAQTLTLKDLELVSDDDLPGMTGLVVLPHPLIVKGMTGGIGDDRAYTWRYPSQIQVSTGGRLRRHAQPAVRMSAYCDTYGPVRPDSFAALAGRARAQGTPLPPLFLDGIRCWPLRYTPTPGQVRDLEEYAAIARRAGDDAREIAAASGLDEGRIVGEYRPGQEIEDHDDTFMPRFLYAFWRLCEQRIAVAERPEPNHSARVAAARAGVSPEVRVIALRRVERARSTGSEPGSYDWHHHWVVRVHKVQQWYPSNGQHKLLFRGPFIKGDLDKPLLDGETVRGLVR
jgi:hypothetical protein